MRKIQKVLFGITVVSAMLAAFFNLVGSGNIGLTIDFLLFAAIFALIWGIIVLGEIDTKQQAQIDDLKRELEEMKRKLEQ